MYTRGQSDQQSDQDQPLVVARSSEAVRPADGAVEDQYRKCIGQGVNFAFGGIEPERIGKQDGCRTDYAAADHRGKSRSGEFPPVFPDDAFSEIGDHPQEQHDGHSACKTGEYVHHEGDTGRIYVEHVGDHRAHHLEQGCSRGVSYFQFNGRSRVFRAVPQRSGGFRGEDVYQRTDGEHQPPGQYVDVFLGKGGQFHRRLRGGLSVCVFGLFFECEDRENPSVCRLSEGFSCRREGVFMKKLTEVTTCSLKNYDYFFISSIK